MIVGSINAFRQAVISLRLIGPTGRKERVSAVIDTGYDGYLTVTPDIAARLQLPLRETRTFEMSNGDLVDYPIHDVTVRWDSRQKDVPALITAGGCMVGMSLLAGYTLHIDAVDGGEVRISARGTFP